jgi:hypothetical protein
VVTSNPASNTELAASDFTSLGTTDKGASTWSAGGWSTAGYNTITLSDNTLVAKEGITKLGVRQSNDLTNAQPTWSEGSNSEIQGYFAEETSTANDPKLVVTHAVAATGTANLFSGKIGGTLLTGKL